MKLWQKIIFRLLYLTPFGYLLSILFLLQGKKTGGISVNLKSYSPITVSIKEKPSFNERINWLINGIFLLSEGYLVLTKEIAGDVGGGFALVAFIFGLISLISAFYPSIPWNRKII